MQGVLSFSIIRKLILPVILVLIGCSIIFKDLINGKINEKIKKLNKDGLPDYIAVFSGQDAKIQNQEFKGANAEAIFGGVELDLREAIINEDQIINATSIFGGIDIFLPSNVKVEVKSTPIFGGVSNNTIPSKEENAPTIYINGFCLFGGVDIK